MLLGRVAQKLPWILGSALVCGVMGCDSSKTDDKKDDKTTTTTTTTTPTGNGPSLGGSLNLKFVSDTQSTATALNALPLRMLETLGSQKLVESLGMNPAVTALPAVIGQSEVSKLKSAKFRVIDIVLCGSTDESNGDACLGGPEFKLYQEGTQGSDYNTFVPSVAKDHSEWTDFVSATSLASLSKGVSYSSQNVGKYLKVVVHFYRSFKINAEVALNDGRTLYTKASSNFLSNGKSDLEVTYVNDAPDLTAGPSEDAVFFLPNGGKTFYLQSPFEISAQDVADKVEYKMVLAFDPDNLIKGKQTARDGYLAQQFLEGQIDANGLQITAPFIEFAPVVAKSTETVMRETYELKFSGDNPYAVRLSLYYVKEDAAKAVRAVTSNLVYTEETSSAMNFNPLSGIRGVKANADGTFKILQGATEYVTIESFRRHGTDETPSGTQKYCGGTYAQATGCSIAETTVNYTSKFLGTEQVDPAN